LVSLNTLRRYPEGAFTNVSIKSSTYIMASAVVSSFLKSFTYRIVALTLGVGGQGRIDPRVHSIGRRD